MGVWGWRCEVRNLVELELQSNRFDCKALVRTFSQASQTWRQPRGKWMVSLVNFHANATSKRWHLWEIDLGFALNSTPGWGVGFGGARCRVWDEHFPWKEYGSASRISKTLNPKKQGPSQAHAKASGASAGREPSVAGTPQPQNPSLHPTPYALQPTTYTLHNHPKTLNPDPKH